MGRLVVRAHSKREAELMTGIPMREVSNSSTRRRRKIKRSTSQSEIDRWGSATAKSIFG